MVWYVCAKLVQMSGLSIDRQGRNATYQPVGMFWKLVMEIGDDSTEAGASAVHTIQTETRCGEDDGAAGGLA